MSIWWVFAVVIPRACSTGFMLGCIWGVAMHMRRRSCRQADVLKEWRRSA